MLFAIRGTVCPKKTVEIFAQLSTAFAFSIDAVSVYRVTVYGGIVWFLALPPTFRGLAKCGVSEHFAVRRNKDN